MEKILFKLNSLEAGGIERLAIDIVNNLELSNKKIVFLLEEKNKFFSKELSRSIEMIYIKPKKVVKKLEELKIRKKRNVFFKIYYEILNCYKKYSYAKNINNYIKRNNVKTLIDYTGSTIDYISKVNVQNKIYWRHLSITEDEIKKRRKSLKHFNRYTKIVTICDEMKEQFNKNFPQIFYKVERIYNFIDEKKIDEKIKKEEKLGEKLQKENYCISVGRLTEPKDYETTIKAFKILKEKNLKEKLYIIGDGDLKEKLWNLIKEYNLENQIFLLGAKDNPYIYMKYADLFIHSSKLEGFPMVLLEALYIRVPIISSNFKTGAYELIEKEKTGEIFEVGDYKTLALKIEKLLNNEDKRKEYINKSKEFVKKFYLENIMKEYKKFIEGL